MCLHRCKRGPCFVHQHHMGMRLYHRVMWHDVDCISIRKSTFKFSSAHAIGNTLCLLPHWPLSKFEVYPHSLTLASSPDRASPSLRPRRTPATRWIKTLSHCAITMLACLLAIPG